MYDIVALPVHLSIQRFNFFDCRQKLLNGLSDFFKQILRFLNGYLLLLLNGAAFLKAALHLTGIAGYFVQNLLNLFS